MFAQTICEDFDLPMEPSRSRIAEAIKERVRESEQAIVPQSTLEDAQNEFTDEDVEWWKRMRKEALSLDQGADDEDKPMPVDDLILQDVDGLPYDLRIRIQVSRTQSRVVDRVVAEYMGCSSISSLAKCIWWIALSGTYSQRQHQSSLPRYTHWNWVSTESSSE